MCYSVSAKAPIKHKCQLPQKGGSYPRDDGGSLFNGMSIIMNVPYHPGV